MRKVAKRFTWRWRSLSKISDDKELRIVERRLLDELAEPRSITDLIERIKPDATEGDIREAVWDLIDRGRVTLTTDRKLKVPDQSGV
jgi:hypothetical protein